MNTLQLTHLHEEIDNLQKQYGHPDLNAIYGAGCIENPKVLFLFMNPTARNISSVATWKGLRAPWIGTKNIWKLLNKMNIVDSAMHDFIQKGSIDIWTYEFAMDLYRGLANKGFYVTNLAKCTQIDAHGLKDSVFRAYLLNTQKEILSLKPKKIIAFGNQVSSILLGKKIKVSEYKKDQKEMLYIEGSAFDVYPSYYPVGQGMRNIDKAVTRITYILQDR